MLFLCFLNIMGVEIIGKFSILFAIIILGPFVLLVARGIPDIQWNLFIQTKNLSDMNWPIFMSIVLWSYNGWDSMGNIAASIKKPRRTFPLAMIICVLLVVITTLFPIAIGLCIDKDWNNWKTPYFPKVAKEVIFSKKNFFFSYKIFYSLVELLVNFYKYI